jgi:hypothetical protein
VAQVGENSLRIIQEESSVTRVTSPSNRVPISPSMKSGWNPSWSLLRTKISASAQAAHLLRPGLERLKPPSKLRSKSRRIASAISNVGCLGRKLCLRKNSGRALEEYIAEERCGLAQSLMWTLIAKE